MLLIDRRLATFVLFLPYQANERWPALYCPSVGAAEPMDVSIALSQRSDATIEHKFVTAVWQFRAYTIEANASGIVLVAATRLMLNPRQRQTLQCELVLY